MNTKVSNLIHPKYRPDIDGLRGVAVLAVLAFHAFPSLMKGGFIGVDVFFVISGFLISTIIFNSVEKGTFTFSEFYSRRIRRIFPALIVVFITCLLFGWACLLADELNQIGKHIAAGAGFVSNLILWNEAGYFDVTAETKPLLHLWSLGIEEQFYIVWPPLIWIAWKLRLNILFLNLFITLASFSMNIWQVNYDSVGVFYSPFSRFWELLCGSLLAHYCFNKNTYFCIENFLNKFILFLNLKNNIIKKSTLKHYFSLIGPFLLILGFLTFKKDMKFPGYWALVPVMASVLIILNGPSSWFNKYILSNKFLMWIGLISFPLYLWHWPILSFARIIYSDKPPLNFRLFAVVFSIFLAWVTMRFIERPFRFNIKYSRLFVTILSLSLGCLGLIGAGVYTSDLNDSHSYSRIAIKRKKGEHILGSSINWFEGKENWLFLGNAFDNSVAKLKLSILPTKIEIESTKKVFLDLSETAHQYGAKTVFILGPDKTSIYPEYLPDGINPASKKYSSFFLDGLKQVPHLSIYDPTFDLVSVKTNGLLYLKSDTHWNNKGAYFAFSGFCNFLNIPTPNVRFKHGTPKAGDLVEMSGLKKYPLTYEDTWDVVWNDPPDWSEKSIIKEQKTSFGYPSLVVNNIPISNQYVWVVGDSFSKALRQYFNATFAQVRYVGHWNQKLNSLPLEIENADKKPNLIVIVRVERSF